MIGKRDDMVVHEPEPYNAEPPRGALAEAPLTPVATFYSRNHGPNPLPVIGSASVRWSFGLRDVRICR